MGVARSKKRAATAAATVIAAVLVFGIGGMPASASGPNGINVTVSSVDCEITVTALWARTKPGQRWLVVALFDNTSGGSNATTVGTGPANGQAVFTAAPSTSADLFSVQALLVSSSGSVLLAGSSPEAPLVGTQNCTLLGNT